jgi:hypothetical protein
VAEAVTGLAGVVAVGGGGFGDADVEWHEGVGVRRRV